jgi:predicted esterase
MSNKIAGARRKLARVYELEFLDAPLVLETETEDTDPRLAWWSRDDSGKHILVQDAFDYVIEKTKGKSYDALLGFSQGGALATALALSGVLDVKAVVTAGSPYIEDTFEIAKQMADNNNSMLLERGKAIPKLHFAGETDAMVPVESTRTLCEKGGNGVLIVHEKGHLFPTKAVHTNYMLEFLAEALEGKQQQD